MTALAKTRERPITLAAFVPIRDPLRPRTSTVQVQRRAPSHGPPSPPRPSRYAALSPASDAPAAPPWRGAPPPSPRGGGTAPEGGGAVAQHQRQLCCATAPPLRRQAFSPASQGNTALIIAARGSPFG